MPRERLEWIEQLAREVEQLARDYGLAEDEAYVYAYLVEGVVWREHPEGWLTVGEGEERENLR